MDMHDVFTSVGSLTASAVLAFILAKRGTDVVRRRMATAYCMFAIAVVIQFVPWSTAELDDVYATARYYWLAGIQTSLIALAGVFFLSGVYALHKGARASPV